MKAFRDRFRALLFSGFLFMPLSLSAQDFEQEAKGAFQAIPNKTIAKSLDDFIQFYRGTDSADVAFTLRYGLVKSTQIIEDYNGFIERYRDTIAGELAVQEVYELYSKRESAASLLAFMDRYPETSQAFAAKMKMHSFLFDTASRIAQDEGRSIVDRLETLDGYVDINKNANQNGLAILLAKAVYVEFESAERKRITDEVRADINSRFTANATADVLLKEKLISQETLRRWNDHANALATTFETHMSGIDSFLFDSKSLEALSDSDRTLALRKIRAAERLGFVIQAVYSDMDAAARVREEQRFIKASELLIGIQQAIAQSNARLIASFREESTKLNQQIREGFKVLENEMRAMNNRLDVLHADLQATQGLLNQVNQQVVKLQTDLANVAQIKTKTNELLLKQTMTTERVGRLLDQDLAIFHDSLVKLNQDMNKGFVEQKKAVKNLSTEVQRGFNQAHKDALRQIEAQQAVTNAALEGFEKLDHSFKGGFNQLDQRLVQQLDQSARLHYEAMRFSADLNRQTLEKMDVNGADKLAAINNSSDSIRSGLKIVNTSINDSSAKIQSAIYSGANMVAERVDRGVAGLNQTIVKTSEAQIYQLQAFRAENARGFESVNREVRAFGAEFRKYSRNTQGYYAKTLGSLDKVSRAMDRSTTPDFIGQIGDIIGGIGSGIKLPSLPTSGEIVGGIKDSLGRVGNLGDCGRSELGKMKGVCEGATKIGDAGQKVYNEVEKLVDGAICMGGSTVLGPAVLNGFSTYRNAMRSAGKSMPVPACLHRILKANWGIDTNAVFLKHDVGNTPPDNSITMGSDVFITASESPFDPLQIVGNGFPYRGWHMYLLLHELRHVAQYKNKGIPVFVAEWTCDVVRDLDVPFRDIDEYFFQKFAGTIHDSQRVEKDADSSACDVAQQAFDACGMDVDVSEIKECR